VATLSITIPDAQVSRVLAAFGHDGAPGDWVSANQNDIRAWILAQVKQRVITYEGAKAAAQAQATVETDVNSW
jgi:hypothetical protein